jgi:hypothetical protein
MRTRWMATIEGGRLAVCEAARWRAFLACQPAGRYVVTCERWRARRSDSQNAYYWGVVIPLLAEVTGYTGDETHEALKAHFLMDRTGKLPKVRSSAALDTKEFSEYVETIRNWAAAEMGCNIPGPDDPVSAEL